jgi:SpoIID/LytB domain protein
MVKKILFFLFLILISLFIIPSFTHADELDDISKTLADLKRALEMSINATTPLEKNLGQLQNQLDAIRGRITVVEKEVNTKQKQVAEGEQLLIVAQELLVQKVRTFYKASYQYAGTGFMLLTQNNLTSALRSYGYQKAVVQNDRDTIVKVVLYIKDLEIRKKQLEDENIRLAAVKAETDKQAAFLQKEITGAKKYQLQISSQIAQLSARQRDIIAQRQAGLNIPRSASALGACVDDRDKDPGFSPRFALFTFGVPNRVGLNQWGAYGRAKSGQNEETILRAYYDNFELKKDYKTDITIRVDGYGNYNIEDYVKRIYEVPDNWGNDGFAALKAQAVAARSYALAYTNNGAGSICATDSCQVFQPNPKGGNWERAVNETKGWVMTQGGQPIKAWFSSTHGGYVLSSGEIGWSSTSWTKHGSDTKESASSISDLKESNKAYDKESPWFYCDWGARAEYNKTAWLRSEEMADIANVIMLVRKDSSLTENMYQVDKPNPAGKETWGFDRVKTELRNRGGTPFNSVSTISVSADIGSGKTTGVTVSGDSGSQNFDGNEFKNYFNVRAPGNIQIVGPLYNVERK